MTQTPRQRRRKRIRAKVSGTALRPRLSVFKSNEAVYAQVIDDINSRTLVAASGADALAVGRELGEKALKKKIEKVVFDRGGYIYTGKIKSLAEGARQAGLIF